MIAGERQRIVIFGAGNIGLAFLGQLFARGGYQVVFADLDEVRTSRLREHGGYTTIMLSPDGTRQEHWIHGIRAISAADSDGLREELAGTRLVATAVGARAFGAVMRTLSTLIPDPGILSTYDVIAAENIHDARAAARDTLGVPGAVLSGIHPCSVGKMVPVQRIPDDGPLAVRAEAFNTLFVDGTDWRGTRPTDVPGIELVAEIGAWMDRKLYVHNLGHSACAWFARATDPEIPTIADAMASKEIAARVHSVMMAAVSVVAALHPSTFTTEHLQAHVADLLYRFTNPQLEDGVERVGQDLRRKLGPDERIAGCMRHALVRAPGALPLLREVYRAALAFGVPGVSANADDVALTVRFGASESGFWDALREVSGFSL